MKNASIQSLNSNQDFTNFIDTKFDKPVKKFKFPEKYDSRRTPKSFLEKTDPTEAENIIKRERIRDNIYIDYKFDIFEYPITVYFENGKSSEYLKPFKKFDEAEKFCENLRTQGIYSLLIMIMNHEVECKIYK